MTKPLDTRYSCRGPLPKLHSLRGGDTQRPWAAETLKGTGLVLRHTPPNHGKRQLEPIPAFSPNQTNICLFLVHIECIQMQNKVETHLQTIGLENLSLLPLCFPRAASHPGLPKPDANTTILKKHQARATSGLCVLRVRLLGLV